MKNITEIKNIASPFSFSNSDKISELLVGLINSLVLSTCQFGKLIAIITLFITQFGVAQTCDVPNNIYQNASDTEFESTSYDFGQSFTADCNGHIQSIKVFTTQVSAPVSGTLNIYAGTPPFTGVNTVAPVYQQAVSWGTSSSETTQIIELTPSFAVVSGTKYTYIITGTAGKVTYQVDQSNIGTGNTYPDGFFMYRNPSTSYWQRDGGRDQKFQIHYTDVIAPEAQCKNATIYLDANGEATIEAIELDNNTQGGVVSRYLSKSNFDCTNVGANTVTLTVNDASLNSSNCDAIVTVVDNLSPVNTSCPQNIVVNNCGLSPVSYDIPTFTDNCEVVSVNRIAGPESGAVFPINQTTTVTHRATDSSGNFTDCTFTVTPQDLISPTVTGIPDDQIINLSNSCDSFIPAYEPLVSDNCPGVVTEQTTGISGTGPFPLGTTVNTFTFTDLGGNVTTKSFTVTVNDNLSPLTCIQVDDIYVETETTVGVDFNEPTFTGCGTLTQTIGDPSGTALSEGDYPIEYTLYNHNGEVSETCSFTIHVASSINYFITTWKTYNANETITIPTFAGETYNYEVDWNYNENNGFISGGTYIETDKLTSNQYAIPGTYKIAIRGNFPRIFFNNGAVSRNNIIEINQWGSTPWTSMNSAFAGCTNLDLKALDTPDLSNAISFFSMFSSCENLEGSEANWDWNVSTINNMFGVFFNASNFNGDISSWNTGNVQNMGTMFEGASSFNQPIVNWNTSLVQSMQNLFKDATSFNQNIGGWDLSSLPSDIYSMKGMFENVTLDTDIYDAILINWATDTSALPNDGDDDIPTGIELHSGNSQYCLAGYAWNKLGTDHTWNIIDDGLGNNGCNNNAEDLFITTWDVESSTDLNILIPTTGDGYAYQVDWNYDENIGFDAASDPRLHTGSADHDYTATGIKKIAIRGDFPRIYFNEGYIGNQIIGDHKKILTVEQWGSMVWTSMNNAFSSCINLNIIAEDVPNLSNVTDMTNMFAFCENLTGNAKFNEWDVSSVQNMSKMFEGALIFNQDINAWNVGNVTSMHSMFSFAEIFNKPLSGWDVSSVANMGSMFFSAYQFNQPIGNWDVSSLITAQSMFQESAFNQNIGDWDISKVTNMSHIFLGLNLDDDNYNDILIGWGTDSSPLPNDGIDDTPSNINLNLVDNYYCSAYISRLNLEFNYGWNFDDYGLASDCITNYFVTIWNTTAGETITIPTAGTGYTFIVDWGDGAITVHNDNTGEVTHQYTTTDASREIKISGDFPRIYFNGDDNGDKDKILSIEEWGDNAWTSMENAFMGCSNLDVTATDVPNLSNTTSMFTMFGGCTNLVGDQANWDWDVSSIDNMAKLFLNAENFNQPINSWEVINVKNMSFMFAGAVSFNERLDYWDVDNVTNMDSMFAGAVNFNQQIASWNVDNVVLMGSMFAGAVNFDEYIDGWVVSSVIDMGSMFSGATSFNQDLNSWNVSNVQTMYNMFDGATNFNGDISGWDVSSVTQMFSMFADASSFDQDLGNWDLSSVLSMYDMFENVTLSTRNYDATLMGWATDTSPSSTDEDDDVPIGMNFYGGNSQYCSIEAWSLLTATSGNGGYNWTIVDGDLDPTCGETYFITTWNLSDLSDLSITIPTATGETYNYEVDWNHDPANGFNSGGTYTGDATSPSNQYAAAGEYKVAIRGDFPRIFFGGGSGEDKIIDINQWGTNPWTSMFGAFTGCVNIDITAQDTPDLSNADNMQFMFAYSTNFDGSTANWHWDVSTITNMSRVFQNTSFIGNASISSWNTSKVTKMVHMFKATSFNINIGNWDLSSMIQYQMDGMFEEVTLSTAVYDAILFGWATDSTVPGDGIDDIPVNTGFHGGNSRSCASEDAWNTLNTDNSWNIIDGGGCSDSDLFITTWSVEENGTITIPTTGTGYDYVIDWNYNGSTFNSDGITYSDGDTATSPSYSVGGTYEIAVFGNFPRIYFSNQGDNDKITEIKQWGTGAWLSMENAFQGCANVQIIATDSPDFSSVTSTDFMFSGCQALTGHESMNDWEMSAILSMRQMFTSATNFNANISDWEVSNTTDMFGLFLAASTFDQDISSWNVGKVTNMESMFNSASSFNKNIGEWNVALVENMENMFYGAVVFNQEIGGWNVGLVENTRSMFYNASEFDGDISSWNTENVSVMSTMFRNATSFNQDLGSWNVSNVTNMYEMFAGATVFDQNIGTWDISSLNTANGTLGANGMFSGVELSVDNYNALLIGWATDTSPGDSVDDIPTGITFSGGNSAYCEATAARALLISDYGWTFATDDTYLPAYCGPEEDKFKTTWVVDDADKSVRIPTTGTGYNYIVNWGDGTTTINHNGDASHNYENPGTYQISISGDFPRIFFEDALSNNDKKIISIDHWGAQVWSTMESAFSYCTNLEMNATDMPNLSQVESMDEMFRGCSAALFNPSIGSWDVSNVTSMRRLFIDAYLFDRDINAWNVGNVTNMSYMFNNAQLFNKPLNNWDVSSVTNMEGMFFKAETFDQDLSDWDISMLSNASRMFEEIELSIENYDALLIGWSTLDISEGETQIPTGVSFNGGNSIYCDGAAARGVLSNPTNNWGISDSGECGFFATTWQTTEANESITIYTSSTDLPSLPDVLEGPFVYDYNIDWGDGQVDLNVTGNISHTYLTAGDHKVRIEGVFPHMSASNGAEDTNNASKLKSIDVWGDLEWKSMAYSFTYCSNMELNASDSPDVSQVTNMIAAFAVCYKITDPDLSGWDVSNVENMRYTFLEAVLFTGDVTQWDVSSVTDMTFMFSDALQFNGDINGWNVSNVITMEGMFSDANTFNRDLNDWDITSVKNMEFMFNGDTHFNGNISSWDVSGVTSMFGMFSGNEGFNQNIGSWDVQSVDNISYMFDGATAFDQNLATWDLSNVLTAENIFTGSGISLANYDDTLIGWATDSSPLLDDAIDDIPNNVILDASVTYCSSESERQKLIDDYGWNIDDGGLDSNCAVGVLVSPKVFLQGAALDPNAGEEDLMRDDLRVADVLPTTSPYGDGLTCEDSVFDTGGTSGTGLAEDDIVDWIWVELRDATDITSVVASQSALLQRDGDIVGVDGTSVLSFELESNDYYVVVDHRNHIAIATDAVVGLTNTEQIVDLTVVANVRGTTNAVEELTELSIYAMIPGDVDSNGGIQTTDINPIISAVGVLGYSINDLNLNGAVQTTDTPIATDQIGKIKQF